MNSDLCFIVRRKGPAIKPVYVSGYIMLNDMTMFGIKSDRRDMSSTNFSFFSTTGRTKLRMTFVRDNSFLIAMRANKKIIAKIDRATKNRFLNIIISNISNLAPVVKRADIVDIIVEYIGKRFFTFNLFNMIKII